VAGNLEITNGHAARMRFSRFKQQMEGIQPPPRKPRTGVAYKKPAKEKPKPKSKPKAKAEKMPKKEKNEINPKMECQDVPMDDQERSISNLYDQDTIKALPRLKDEPLENGYPENVGNMDWVSLDPGRYPEQEHKVPKLEVVDPNLPGGYQEIKEEPRVKREPRWD
jgi:hypothetical protein